MHRTTAILFTLFIPAVIGAQSPRPFITALADSIAVYNQLDGPIIGEGGVRSPQYSRVQRFSATASTSELLYFTTHSNNSTLKCAAFKGLCQRDTIDILPLLIKHLYDTTWVSTMDGCIISGSMTGDIFLETFYLSLPYKDTSYFIRNYEKLASIDSIIFYDPAIRLASKEARVRSINADSNFYDRVREIAIKERLPVSVLTLAKYKKQQDKEIIESYFRDEQTKYYAIWAVREFPDSSFYPLLLNVFETEWKVKRYDYSKWRILYQALAKYPTPQTLALFDKTINAGNKFRRETLGRYLAIAIAKYPHPAFDKYKGMISIDDLHGMYLKQEMEAEK